jgi:CheY-like chemotaxis protein
MILQASRAAFSSLSSDAAMTADTAPLAGRKILVVEDEAIVSMLIEDMLIELGAEVVCASNVASALKLLAQVVPDASVLDVNLGHETAFPVAEQLAAARIPFVFSTGYGGTGLPPAWSGRPVVQKPYAVEDLCNVLVTELARARVA